MKGEINLYYFVFIFLINCRKSLGERLQSEESNVIRVSGSRGNREMTFTTGKVWNILHCFSLEILIYKLMIINNVIVYCICRKSLLENQEKALSMIDVLIVVFYDQLEILEKENFK